MTVPTIFDTCRPRADVLTGAMTEADFAADLAQVILGEGGGPPRPSRAACAGIQELHACAHRPGRLVLGVGAVVVGSHMHRDSVTGHFDKPEGVLKQWCALQDLRHLFYTFTNPIADDQQQKPPISETAVDRVNEGGLSGRVVVKITGCCAVS